MPTVLMEEGFRFFFYSNEGNEPMHIHVEKGEAIAKIWLDTLEVEYVFGFSNRELRRILTIIETNLSLIKSKWYEHFNQ